MVEFTNSDCVSVKQEKNGKVRLYLVLILTDSLFND